MKKTSFGQPLFKLKTPSFILICLLLFCYQSGKANYLGADITYKCLGANQYQVNLTLYQKCNGTPMPTQVTLQQSSLSCGVASSNIILPIDSSYEIPQFCPSEQANSTCLNSSGSQMGIQAVVYSDVITLGQVCTDWVIGWSHCCRDSSITTLSTPLGAGIYIEAGINNTVCNSSPVFHNAPLFYACAGVMNEYNAGLVDEEIDWQWHLFTCAKEGPDSCLAYSTGLSATAPFFADTLTYDSINGHLAFRPTTGLSQKAPLKQTIQQVNSFNDTVGYIQRDFLLEISGIGGCNSPLTADNKGTSLTCSTSPTPNTTVICSGETLIFDLIAEDSDGDTIMIDSITTNLDAVFGANNWTIFLNAAPPFKHDSAQIFIQIQATAEDIGMNSFTLGFSDQTCPKPNITTKSFNLIIPGVNIIDEHNKLCYGAAQAVQMQAYSYGRVGQNGLNYTGYEGSFLWEQKTGPVVTFSDDTLKEPIVYFPNNLNYGDSIVLGITYTTVPYPTTGVVCTTTDDITFFVDSFGLELDILASDNSLCPNNPDSIDLSIATNPIVDATTGQFSWTTIPAVYQSSLDSNTSSNPQAHLSGIAGDSITFVVNYNLGVCSGTGSLQLKWSEDSTNISATLDTICPGDTIQLSAGLSNSVYTDLAFTWAANPFMSNVTNYNPSVFPQVSTLYHVDLDRNGCIYKDSIEIIVNSALHTPSITCGTLQNAATAILYEWGQVNGATAWEYSLDAGQTWINTLLQDSSLLVTGLTNGSSSEIWVRAVGGGTNCVYNAASIFNCTTIDTSVALNALTLTATLSGANISYQWVDCDNGFAPIAGANSQNFTPIGNGNYAVIISNGSSTAMSSCFNINVTNLNTTSVEEAIVLYPNPTRGLVQLVKNSDTDIYIELMDAQGKILLSQSIQKRQTSLDLNPYPAGIYMLSISTAQKVRVEKIIKF